MRSRPTRRFCCTDMRDARRDSAAKRELATPRVSLRTLLDGRRPPVEGRAALTLRDDTHEILASGFPGLRHLTGRALRA